MKPLVVDKKKVINPILVKFRLFEQKDIIMKIMENANLNSII